LHLSFFFIEYDRGLHQAHITIPPLDMKEYRLTNIRLQNVTRLDLGIFLCRQYRKFKKYHCEFYLQRYL
jgi:hypothetical protein